MLLKEFSTIFDRPEKVKKLREYILSLAVMGKLVAQDENDEPASILLEKIREENEELKLQGRYNKQRKIKDTVDAEKAYGYLPNGWKWCLLDDVVPYITDYQANGSFSTLKANVKTYKEEEYAILVRLKDLRQNIKNGDLLYTDKSGYEFLSKSPLYGGEILIANVGAVGTSMVMPKINKKATIAPNMFIIELSKYIDKDYFLYFTKTCLYKDEILNKSSSTAQPKMNKNEFRSLTFPLPPLNEQKRIVEKVDYLMEFCDKLEEQLEIQVKYATLSAKSVLNGVSNCSSYEDLEEALRFIIDNFKDLTLADGAIGELKNAILSLAVKGKLVPQDESDEPASVLIDRIREEKDRLVKEKKIKKEKPLPEIGDDEIPYEISKGWKWVRLGELCKLITKGSSPKWQGINYIDNDNGVLFITSENVGKFNIILNNKKYLEYRFNEIEPRSILEKGDLLTNIVGASIGRTAMYDLDEVANINQAVCIIRTIDNSIYKPYLLNFLNCQICIGYMYDKQVDCARANLSMSNIARFLIPIPPLNEQKRIVEKVDKLMKVCYELELRIEESKKYNEKLMESILKENFKA